ncbi:MAG: retron St85 family effector protein [Pseudomonadota bacterium]
MESNQHTAFFNQFIKEFRDGIAKVDFDNTKVRLDDDEGHRLFLCGGEISNRVESRSRSPLMSMRDLIYKLFIEKYQPEQLVLAETKANNSIYRNQSISLLEFEKIISQFSTAVLVVLESVGSFVEIGSFTSLEALKEKLYTLIDDKYSTHTSFLVEGPLRELENDRKHVLDYRFSDSNPEKRDRALVAIAKSEVIDDEMYALIEKTRVNRKQTESFSKDNHFHYMLLVSNVIEATCPLKLREIHSLIAAIGVEVKESFLEVLLQLSQDFGLLKRRTLGGVQGQAYYCSTKPYAKVYLAGRKLSDGRKLKFQLDDFGIQTLDWLSNKYSVAEKHRRHLKSEELDD